MRIERPCRMRRAYVVVSRTATMLKLLSRIDTEIPYFVFRQQLPSMIRTERPVTHQLFQCWSECCTSGQSENFHSSLPSGVGRKRRGTGARRASSRISGKCVREPAVLYAYLHTVHRRGSDHPIE